MLRKKLKPYRFGLNKSNNEGDNRNYIFYEHVIDMKGK